MRLSLDLRVESLLFLAFMATVPVYSPTMVMFTKGFPYVEPFMPYFIYTLLGLTAVGGIALGLYSLRRTCERALSAPVVGAAAICYLVGYIIFALIGGIAGLGSVWLTICAAALLAFGTVILGVAWGVYLARYYDLRQALVWIGIMVGASSVLQMLLSSVAFQVGAVVFFVLLAVGVAPLCYFAVKGNLAPEGDGLDFDGALAGSGEADGSAERRAEESAEGSANGPSEVAAAQGVVPVQRQASLGKARDTSLLQQYFSRLRSMAKVLMVPFIGLLVFAYVMGVRKYILFDLIYVEMLGGIGGAILAVGICFVKRARPLLPYIYQVAMPLFALVIIVLSTLLVSDTFVLLHTCLSFAFFGAIGVFSLASLCAMAHAKEFDPVLIYSSTTAAFSLASAFGLLCGTMPLFIEQSGEGMLNLIATLYFAFLLAYSLITNWRRMRSCDPKMTGDSSFDTVLRSEEGACFGDEMPAAKGRGSGKGSEGEQETQDVASRCLKVAEVYKLSPRETEIFGYLGRGHGVVFIAETLVISDSTVRTHVKNIYKKIGVSSREELLQLVDQR